MGSLQELWKDGAGTGYPADYQGITNKATVVISALDHLQGRHVLDIGCNSGLYTYLAGFVANHVTGVDVEQPLIDRAERARPLFISQGLTGPVDFASGTFTNYLHPGISGIIAACVLYHVGDDYLRYLQDFLRQHRPKMIIQTRPGRAEAFRLNPSWGVLATTAAYEGMFTIESNLAFLADAGYDRVEVVGLTSSVFCGEAFPVVVTLD